VIDLLLDKILPSLEWIGVVDVGLVCDEVLDKCGTPRPTIDPPSQFGVERDGAIQQQRRCRFVPEMACIHERIDIADRGKELERSRKESSAVE